MKKLALHWQILIGLILGGLFGFYFPDKVQYVGWMGDLFIRALKMIIVPIILTSVMSGIVNIGSLDKLGKLGAKTLGYYLTTSLFAIVTGLLFVNLFKPGVGADLGFAKEVEHLDVASQGFGSTLMNIIPTNIFSAFSNGDMLSIIFFAIMAGYFTTQLAPKYNEFVVTSVNAGFELIMKITHFIIRFTPLGIFGIIALQVARTENLADVIGRLGLYAAAVLCALFVHACITLPLMMRLIAGINPLKHLKALSTPLITAFSTSSSSATMPLTLDAMENNSGVSNKVTSFVIPLGSTVNMDGTALYECVAAMFIAQAYGLELGFAEQALVVMTALLASIGAAGIPMAGLVMIGVILGAIGLPLEGVGLILAIDRILDMFRTTVNVWSDTCGTVIIAKSEGETLNYDK